MSGLMAQLVLWLWLCIAGFLLTRTVLRATSPWIVLGSALPVAMVALLGLTYPLSRLVGHPRGWMLAVLLMFVATVTMYVKRDRLIATSLDDFGFSPVQWACFMTLLSTASLVMHTREALGPEDDYWIHFPLISLLHRGEFPPPNPFFHDLSLHGHFGRDYLIAVLGWLSGGGLALLSSTWIFNHSLQASAFFLAFGLGKREGGNAGGFLMACLLFFGISVGSRVGLMDTYDNNNLLVYVLLLLFAAIEANRDSGRRADVFLTLALGVYGIIYETHMLLFLMVLWAGPLMWRRSAKLHALDWRRPLAVSLGSLLAAALLGGPIQDLALRLVGGKDSRVDHAATYQEQRVQISFPKQHLFQILVGPERYRRLSYVYQGKAFSGLQNDAVGEGEDARQSFRYAFILGPDVLLMHWLALYLGLPAGLWLIRRGSREGALLWTFGLTAFLVPALVDFGPVHEREYFRWEFAAGFGFAGALAVALAYLWPRGKIAKMVVVLLAVAVTLGGERKVNRTLIEIDKMPDAQRAIAASPFYPSPERWILGSRELRMDSDLVAASLELKKRSQPQDRLVTDLDARSHWEIFRESTVCGLAGLRSVGHASPPPWMQDGIAPFFRSAGWNYLWQTGDIRVLPSLGARWLLVREPKHREMLGKAAAASPDLLKEVSRVGEVALWRYSGPFLPDSSSDSGVSKPTLVAVERGAESSLQGETVQSMTLVFAQPLPAPGEVAVVWEPEPGTEPGGPIEPLILLGGGSADGARYRYPHALVAPLVEGSYRLKVTVNGQAVATTPQSDKALSVRFDWTSLARRAEVARGDEQTVLFSPGGKELLPPLTVGMRLFRLDESRYNQPFGFEAEGVWSGQPRVQLVPTSDEFSFPIPDGQRPDYFLLDRSGREVPLKLDEGRRAGSGES